MGAVESLGARNPVLSGHAGRSLVRSPAARIRISQRAAARLRAGHLWVYRSDLAGTPDAPAGALVHVLDERRRRLGSALYSSSSQIAIRLLTTEAITEAQLLSLVRERVASAVRFRQTAVGQQIPRELNLPRDDKKRAVDGAAEAAPL